MKNVMIAMAGSAALVLAGLATPTATRGAADAKVDFTKDIEPIFAHSCVKCHGADPKGKKPKGKYDMTTKEGLLKSGDNGGKNLVPGKPDDSLVYKLLLGPVGKGDDEIEKMPSKKDSLDQKEIDLIKAWIAQGAEIPDGIKIPLKE
jgi:mono/diheme cytochrome c family protein